jgi:hypothetical protein
MTNLHTLNRRLDRLGGSGFDVAAVLDAGRQRARHAAGNTGLMPFEPLV